MGEQTFWKKIRTFIGGVGLSIFLWSIHMTENQYLDTVCLFHESWVWTLTKDKLPPDNTEVLAAVGDEVFIERVNPDKDAEQDEDGWLPDKFRRTFDRWMLIPPYKKESDEENIGA